MKPSNDPVRRAYLDTLSPHERSEAAARYDHRSERERLDGPITDEERQAARQSLELARRASVMIDGYESGEINLNFGQLMARLDHGMLPAHIEGYISQRLAALPPISEQEITAAVNEDRKRDREYLQIRYGL